MDHIRGQQLLSEYLDGDLPADTVAELERHIEECERCRAEVESLRATLTALGSLEPAEPPQDFLQQVNQKLRRRGKSTFDISIGLDRKIPFEAVSMVLLGILLALYLLLVALPKEQVTPEPPAAVRRDAGAGATPVPEHPDSGKERP